MHFCSVSIVNFEQVKAGWVKSIFSSFVVQHYIVQSGVFYVVIVIDFFFHFQKIVETLNCKRMIEGTIVWQ